jgi:hypothetical protein
MNTSYTENDYSNNNNTNQKNKSNYKEKAQTGLIPITSNMIKKFIRMENLSFEFLGIQVIDVVIMGNIINSIQEETKLKIQIYDTTGLIDVIFYDRNESNSINEISDFVENK